MIICQSLVTPVRVIQHSAAGLWIDVVSSYFRSRSRCDDSDETCTRSQRAGRGEMGR